MKIQVNKETRFQIFRYIIISTIGYFYVFLSLYLMVTILKIDKSISFMIVYGILYILLYFLQLKILFKAEHNKFKLIRFFFSTFLFYVLANFLYYFFISLGVEYLLATLITIIILMPTRFLVSKYFIYK